MQVSKTCWQLHLLTRAKAAFSCEIGLPKRRQCEYTYWVLALTPLTNNATGREDRAKGSGRTDRGAGRSDGPCGWVPWTGLARQIKRQYAAEYVEHEILEEHQWRRWRRIINTTEQFSDTQRISGAIQIPAQDQPLYNIGTNWWQPAINTESCIRECLRHDATKQPDAMRSRVWPGHLSFGNWIERERVQFRRTRQSQTIGCVSDSTKDWATGRLFPKISLYRRNSYKRCWIRQTNSRNGIRLHWPGV